MKFSIKHEIRGRIRVHLIQGHMSFAQADTLLYYLQQQEGVLSAKVYEQTADAVIQFSCNRENIIELLKRFSYDNVEVPAGVIENSGRELNAVYKEKLINKIIWHYGKRLFLPLPIRTVLTTARGIYYICKGIQSLYHRRLDVSVLDATSILVSLVRQDISTASSIMFLLGVGELLEEWTHKKSVDDLARSMSLNIGKVWQKVDGQEILVSTEQIQKGDLIVVRTGTVIPFDGTVSEGEAMVNQSSLTGESVPVRKIQDNYVYAGTVIDEGELTICVDAVGNSTRFEKIVTMIEESEKLKSGVESEAEHLADRLVPFTLLGTGLTWLITRNATKALSILMVDFSCALKLAMPIAVLSAIREAQDYDITVKGGKYLEAVADATTIVFDKTGTLTKAKPTVVDVIPFRDEDPDELLRIAACLEEHFPHSVARAVVSAAREKDLEHQEMHSKVEYIVAHGISSFIDGKKAVIGSAHFVFDDEACRIPKGMEDKFANLPEEYSHLYLAIENELAAVICIEDPVREEAEEAIRALRKTGIEKVVMMTGDSERAAAAIAHRVGVDEYYSEVLPEDKARFVEQEKSDGRKVIMIGDGINDSPALSAADAGVAISDGAAIAREIADITIAADDLREIVTLRKISVALMQRIRKNYRTIVGFNGMLIALGVGGIIQPTTSSLLHNSSTLYIGLKSMQNLLEEKE
jgi:heavy metal translocating P-type ATPase